MNIGIIFAMAALILVATGAKVGKSSKSLDDYLSSKRQSVSFLRKKRDASRFSWQARDQCSSDKWDCYNELPWEKQREVTASAHSRDEYLNNLQEQLRTCCFSTESCIEIVEVCRDPNVQNPLLIDEAVAEWEGTHYRVRPATSSGGQ